VRVFPLVSSLLSLTLLAACQQRPMSMPAGAIFSLTAATAAAAVPVTPAGRPEATGTRLTVNLQEFLAQFSGFRRVLASIAGFRRVLASIADVEQVVVVVRTADGQAFTQSLSRAAIAGGQTALTFTGLATGEATITVEAFDATQQSIGRAVQRTTVTAGLMPVVTMTVGLGAPRPSSGGQSGGAPPAPRPGPAGLSADVSFADGYALRQIPVSPPRLSAGTTSDFVFDSTGRAWGTSGTTQPYRGLPGSGTSAILQLNAAADTFVGPVDDPYNMAVDSQDRFWTTSLGHRYVTRLDANGATLAVVDVPTVPGPRSLAIDAADNAWVANGQAVTRITASGTAVDTYPMGGVVGAITADPQSGAVWVTVENKLVKLSATGDVLATTAAFSPVASNDFAGLAVDTQGHVWVSVLSDQALAQFGPDGALVGRHALGFPARDLAFDGTGHLWVVGGTYGSFGSGRAAKLSATGRLLVLYGQGETLLDTVVIDPSDHVWVKPAHGLIFRLEP
jgi:sugar lactone lactonase YvrE